MGFLSWLTGRHEKEQDVYANKDQVETVVSNIKKIKANEVESARAAVRSAIMELNNVSQYAATISVDGFDSLFDGIGESIENIGIMLQDKVDDIIAYSESSWLEKGLSTVAMGLFKVGEGVLSVAEDLGDGVVSVAGFVGGIVSKDFQESCANFVKKEWSHDAFNFYYESDFAKASLFTEDSGLAAGCKLVGKAGAYLYAGGVLAGQAGTLGLGSTKLGGAALNVASSSTWGATAAAGLGGIGSGTESGLLRGKTYNQAFGEGMLTGGVSAGLAFAGGKVGEKLAKNAAIKEASKAVDKADDAFKTAQESVEKYAKEMMDPNVTNRMADIAAENYDEALGTLAKSRNTLDAAKDALNTASKAKLSSFQGYTDALSKAGNRFGQASVNVIKDGGKALGQTAAASSAVRKGAVDAGIKTSAAETAQQTFKESLKTLAKENPISQTISAGKNLATSIGSASIKDVATAGAKEGARSAAEVLKHPIEAAKGLISAATPGVAAMGGVAALQEIPNIQAKETFDLINKTSGDWGEKPVVDVVETPPEIPPGEVKPVSVTTDDNKPTDQPTNKPTDQPTDKPTDKPTGDTENPGVEQPVEEEVQYRKEEPVEEQTQEPDVPEEIEPEEIEPEEIEPEEIEPEEIEPEVPEEIEPVVEDDPIKSIDPTEKDTEPTITPVKEDDFDTDKKTPTELSTSIHTPTGGSTSTGTTTGGGGSFSGHTGGGYSSTGGYVPAEEPTGEEVVEEAEVEGLEEVKDPTIDEIVEGKVTKIPTTTVPIQPKAKTKGSAAIPIAAGLSAAAAAGLGAKAYMDRKKNNDNGEDDEFYSDEWEEDESIQIDSENVEENNENESDYLTPDDEYSFATDEEVEKYGARKNNELADLQ